MHQVGRKEVSKKSFPVCCIEALEQQAPISSPLQEWRWFNLRTGIIVEALECPHNHYCGVTLLVLLQMFRNVDVLQICYAVELFCRICGYLVKASEGISLA